LFDLPQQALPTTKVLEAAVEDTEEVPMATQTQHQSTGAWMYIGMAALVVIVIAAMWFYAH